MGHRPAEMHVPASGSPDRATGARPGPAPGRRASTDGLAWSEPSVRPADPAEGVAAGNPDAGAGAGNFLGIELGDGGFEPPASPAARLRFPHGAELPLTREAMRRELESLWAEGGKVRVQQHLLTIEVLSQRTGGWPTRMSPGGDEEAVEVGDRDLQIALGLAREEMEVLAAEEAAFQSRFVRAAKELMAEMLDGSEATVRDSLASYGVVLGPVLERAILKESRTAGEIAADILDDPFEPLTGALVQANPAMHAGEGDDTSAGRAELAAAVQDLLARQAELRQANADSHELQVAIARQRGQLCNTSHHQEPGGPVPDFSYLEHFPAPELTFAGRRFPEIETPGLEGQAIQADATAERLTREFHAAWLAHEARHPVLAAYRDGSGNPQDLEALDGGPAAMNRELVRVSFRTLCAIGKARHGLRHGMYSVWELPRVVELARARLGVEGGTVRDAFIGNAIADASQPDWLEWALSAIALAGAVLLAPATAGSSMAVVADIGLLTLDAYLAASRLGEQSYASAAAHTDFDTQKALAIDEPSLAWLVVDLVAAGISGAALVHAFSSARRLRSAVRTGTAGDEVASLRAELDHLGETTDLGPLGTRVADEATPAAPPTGVDPSTDLQQRIDRVTGVHRGLAHEAAQADLRDHVQQLIDHPPALQDRIDRVTGVDKGPAYDEAQEALRSFYRQMDAEGQQARAIKGQAREGIYAWQYGADAREFSHGLVHFTFKVHLDGSVHGIPAADLAKLEASVIEGVDEYYNFQHTLPGGRRLHVDVEFIKNPADAHISVKVKPGDGRALLKRWWVDGRPVTHAHEVGHGAFGLLDEYVVDIPADAPNRATPTSPGVHHDRSLMGDYWARNPDGRLQLAGDGRPDAIPGTALKPRHLDQITSLVGGAGERAQSPGVASQLRMFLERILPFLIASQTADDGERP